MQRGLFSIAPPNPSALHLGHVAKYLLLARGDRGEAARLAATVGALPRIQNILKTIPIGTTGDSDFGSVLLDARIASDAFVESLSGTSLFATMSNDGALRRVPLGMRLGHVVTGSSSGVVGEGQTIPGSRFTLEGQTVPLIKAASFVVVSNEVASSETAAARALVNNELRKAVTMAVDAKFVSIALASAPTNVAGGADILEAARSLLDNVNCAGAKLYWRMAPNVANYATVADVRGDMTPTGGVFLGVPALVADIAAGTLQLFDAMGFAGDLEGVQIDTSKAATLDLGEPPDSPASASTTLISLFQHNLSSVKATSYFGVKKLRTDAAAEITDITNPDSPA